MLLEVVPDHHKQRGMAAVLIHSVGTMLQSVGWSVVTQSPFADRPGQRAVDVVSDLAVDWQVLEHQ